MRLAIATLVPALLAGCQCGFDAGKLDDLACHSSADCRPDRDCVDDTCTQRPCQAVADCGDAVRFECHDGFCEAPPCDEEHPCGAGYGCGGGYCIPGLPDGGVDGGPDAGVPCGGPSECDDSLDCTQDACVEGFCTHSTQGGFCAIDGACWVGGDGNPENPCQLCLPTSSDTHWSNDDGRAPDDGIECTIDRCIGGQPSFEPQDGLCAGGICSVCAGGCVDLPTLTVACPDVPAAAGGEPAACTITADPPPAADNGCLSCSVVVGITNLVHEDFTGCPDLADVGWSGTFRDLNCPVDRELGPDPDRNDDALRVGDSRAVLERFFDTTGFDAVRLCFDFASADDNRSGLAVDLNTSGAWNEVWSAGQTPPPGGNRVWQNYCLDLVALDPLTAGNLSVGIRFRAANDGWPGNIFLDNISIDAWIDRTIARPGPIVFDDFAGCDIAAWSLTGDAPTCPVSEGLIANEDALGAHNSSFTIDRAIDVSGRCDDLRIGLSVAAHGPDDNERVLVRTDRGDGPLRVWGVANRPRPDDVFVPIEVPLSTIDPAVRFQPDLHLSVQVQSTSLSDWQIVDDVWVDGAECRPAEDLVDAPEPTWMEPGVWALDVAGAARGTAHVRCTWDERSEATGLDTILYCTNPECPPSQQETRACGECGTQTRRCDSNCRWFDWSPCHDRPCSCCDAYGNCSSCCC